MATPTDDAILRWIEARGERIGRIVDHHPRRVDATLAVSLALVSLAGLIAQGRLHHVDTIVFCVLLPAPLLLRTISPTGSFALVAIVALAQWLTSTPQLADGAVLVALFWIALDGELAEMSVAMAVTEVGAIMAALRWSPNDPLKVWVGLTGLEVAAAVVGITIRQRRALIASMQESAARLEFERDQEGRLGAAAERARIAREMHDIVSHNLSVMIALADGASYALQSAPDSSLSAMQRVSFTGRQALEEMRRLLGVLRDEPEAGPYEPQPGLDRLDELLARVESAGIPVSIELQGDPHELSSGLQLTIFRVAQEALTNTLKHAGRPTTAHVSLRVGNPTVELEVIDTGGVAAPRGELPSGGRGLRGMRERAAAYGGQFEAGPRDQGGWRVRLTLDAEVGSPVG